jgi:two-component system, sensor histidine kinase PdtaS
VNTITTRHYCILLTLWLVSVTPTFAQIQEPDSVILLTSIRGMEDRMWVDYPAELVKAQELHQKSIRSNCLSCQAKSFKLLGKFFWANGEYPLGLVQFRRAVAVASKVGDRETQAATFDLMGNTFYYQAYYDSGFYFFSQALKVYERDKNMQGMITVLHNISLMYHRQGDFKKTIEYLFREEQLKDSLTESIHEIEAMGAMGSLMIDSIYYREEITDELNDLKVYRLKSDKKSMARAYRNIAKAYRQLEEYVLAARYFVRSGTLMNELGIVPDWDLAATDYRDANIKDSCFYYHYLAKQNFSKMTQPGISYTLELLGDAHLHFNRPDSAKFYYDSALQMNYRMNNRITFTGIHRYLVNVHRQLENYSEAERHLKVGLELSKEVALIHEMNLYREGKTLYDQMGDYKKALWFSEKYRLYRDSVTKAETAVNLTKLQAEFKTAKKTREVSELQQKNLLNEAQIETRNLQIALAVGMLAAIATVGGLYYSRYRHNKKLNERLQISNKEKEGLLHEIHHRVKNNLQIISSLISLKSRQASAETSEALQQLNGRIFSMGLIHEKLYRNEDIQNIRLDEYLTEVSRQLMSSFEEHEHPITLSLNCQPVEITADKALTCGLIINELVTNAIKYAFTADQQDRRIKLSIQQENGTTKLEISDNGRSSKPISGNFNKSFGSRFVDQLVIAKLGGEWSVKLEDGVHIIIKFTSGLNGTGEN